MKWFGLFGRKDSIHEKKDPFRELMKEYDRTFFNPQERFAILQKAARIAKDDGQKLEVNARLLELRERGM